MASPDDNPYRPPSASVGRAPARFGILGLWIFCALAFSAATGPDVFTTLLQLLFGAASFALGVLYARPRRPQTIGDPIESGPERAHP
jgi:hypothetical protein